MTDNRALIPDGYDEFLRGLKERIRTAQVKAALAVNRELVLLYWRIGQDILERQRHSGWGSKVIDRLCSRPSQCVSGDERLFSTKSQIYEGLRRGLAG